MFIIIHGNSLDMGKASLSPRPPAVPFLFLLRKTMLFFAWVAILWTAALPLNLPLMIRKITICLGFTDSYPQAKYVPQQQQLQPRVPVPCGTEYRDAGCTSAGLVFNVTCLQCFLVQPLFLTGVYWMLPQDKCLFLLVLLLITWNERLSIAADIIALTITLLFSYETERKYYPTF